MMQLGIGHFCGGTNPDESVKPKLAVKTFSVWRFLRCVGGCFMLAALLFRQRCGQQWNQLNQILGDKAKVKKRSQAAR